MPSQSDQDRRDRGGDHECGWKEDEDETEHDGMLALSVAGRADRVDGLAFSYDASIMKSLTVFCSSSPAIDPGFGVTARRLGTEIAARNLTLVYGGGSSGLMGEVATACADADGRIVGVITEHLSNLEVAFDRCDELVVVDTMRRRKALMAERGDGFLILPGGLGTYEEFFEVLVARLLEEHHHPIGILNDQGYYDPLLALLEHGFEQRFIARPTMRLIQCGTDPDALIDALVTADAVEVDPDTFYPARSG